MIVSIISRCVKGVNTFVKDFSHGFSDRLRELRNGRPKTVFARFLGINNPSTYQNYEAGRIPETRIVYDIAQKCGVTVDWLLGNVDQGGPKSHQPYTRPTEQFLPVVRDQPCRYPADCDLPAQIAAVMARLDAQAQDIQKLSADVRTLVNLLAVALGNQINKRG